MNTSRIPAYDRANPNGMQDWFAAMAERDLLFHPEDSAAHIIEIANGMPLFTREESEAADHILAGMFAEHGSKVIDTCYPIFMKKARFPGAPGA